MVLTLFSMAFSKPQFHYRFISQPLKSISTTTTSATPLAIPGETIFAEQYHLGRALQVCTDTRNIRLGTTLHARLLKLHNSDGGSISLWNKVLNLYCRCGHVRRSDQVFDRMSERDIVSYNTMISVNLRDKRDVGKAMQLYSLMLEENIMPNNITLSTLLSGSTNSTSPYLVEQIHAHAIKFELNSDGFVGSALVNSHARCRGTEEAIRAFEEIAELDSVSWNIMIDVCSRSGSKQHTMEIFCRMRKQSNQSFDCFTLTSVLKTCSEHRDLSLGMQLHGCALKAGLELETPIGNALVTMYSKCEERMDSAVQVFRRIPEPNIISWTAMIAGFIQNGLAEEAVSFYKAMLRSGMRENEFSFACILQAFSSLASLDHGRPIHAKIIKSEFWSDIGVGNALIDMYFKCGSLEDAQLVFETMKSQDRVSWTVMITGFGQHGKGREALVIFRAMGDRGFKPDTVTLLAVLSACSHGGLVDEGLQIFHSMVEVYDVKPRREHYACMVDMLGRAGKLKEAERFIGEMGIESDPLAWEALLGASGIHGDKELGERSAEKVMELEPDKDGPYVLLSNIYAEQRMWEEKGKLRQRLDNSGLRKEVASSWFTGRDV